MQINSINHLMALLEMAGRGSAVVGQWVFHHTITSEREPHERLAGGHGAHLRPQGECHGAGGSHSRPTAFNASRSTASFRASPALGTRSRDSRAAWCLCFRMDRSGIRARRSASVSHRGSPASISARNRSVASVAVSSIAALHCCGGFWLDQRVMQLLQSLESGVGNVPIGEL